MFGDMHSKMKVYLSKNQFMSNKHSTSNTICQQLTFSRVHICYIQDELLQSHKASLPQLSLTTYTRYSLWKSMVAHTENTQNEQRFWSIGLWATLLFLSYCDHTFTTPGRVIGTHHCNSYHCETILITCSKSLCVTGCCINAPPGNAINLAGFQHNSSPAFLSTCCFICPHSAHPLAFPLVSLFLSVNPNPHVQTTLL